MIARYDALIELHSCKGKKKKILNMQLYLSVFCRHWPKTGSVASMPSDGSGLRRVTIVVRIAKIGEMGFTFCQAIQAQGNNP